MHRGYIKMWRKCLESGLLQNAEVWQFACWCLLKASHKEKKQIVGSQVVNIKKGQFVFGRKAAAEELNSTERKIRTCLETLKKYGFIDQQTTNKYSLITLINWGSYQDERPASDQQDDQQATNKRPASDQQATTNNNEKNDKHLKHEKKNIYGEFENVKLTDDEFEKLVLKFGEAGTKARIENLSSYVASKGVRYKSHYATILTWARKDQGGSKPAQQQQKPKGYDDDYQADVARDVFEQLTKDMH